MNRYTGFLCGETSYSNILAIKQRLYTKRRDQNIKMLLR